MTLDQTEPTLETLEHHHEFVERHIGPDAAQTRAMLEALGLGSVDELLDAVVPASIRWSKPLDLPTASTEAAALAQLAELAARNEVLTSLIGTGYANTVTPAVIARNVLENPAWYTAYTPYQPEISQGRLEALLNFQTMVSDLCGLDLANASMLDEATAAAEAMAMCRRAKPSAGNRFVVDADCHPQTIAVVHTRAKPIGVEVVVADLDRPLDLDGSFGLLVQHPGSSGELRDHRPHIDAVHAAGGLAVVAADLLALTVIASPGELGADMAVGNSQRFGVPLGFGGPHAGFLAVRDEHKRSLPGRLVGVSRDTEGRVAYRLTLQTREQHIRRERATSNICTAQVLLAVIAGMYACYHGPDGLERIGRRVHRLTCVLAEGLRRGGADVVTRNFFDTLTVSVPGHGAAVIDAALERGYNLRRVDRDTVGVTLDETCSLETVTDLLAAFDAGADQPPADLAVTSSIPAELRRTTEYLTHPVFTAHRSETEMLRYLRRLADRDIALDRAMIPLGSCTMKLNATSEMLPITWPAFADIHPFAPIEQADGYLTMIRQLEQWLAEITGYDAVSVQPNAGSQGEYAGLLAIAAYHAARGETERDVCLIPASAHGTNAASAAMAGMRVVVVACDDDGNVDLADLEAKLDAHGDTLSCLMVTYPSTHGVFETAIGDICAAVHDAGGQVYLDGANLNALVGVAKPGKFGADVSHLNLHKTFCIPHGGGGPGVGPVAVRGHLAPYLPTSPLTPEAGPVTGVGAVSAAPWGSAGILPISWMYIAMMGRDGLLAATASALLAANYVAHRLRDHYPILYSGADGWVAHECILDIRPLTKATGVTVDDVAKRLIDYGFHAPTMSFPVAGTLMVEPTESESLAELDRFCDAMIAIRGEIDRVGSGEWPAEDNPLRNAPHTAEDVTADDWARPYGRSLAAYPVEGLRSNKYWPPVSRIDGAWGDRNVVCACPPLEAFTDPED
ncbi:MAG: aminomethyl-transferring glycine dehydrogenase [Acidimicrobiia bacterium]|nr:aminomethyl-transferring glycine dehydrogenase [Acidimicrobiia bacterium]